MANRALSLSLPGDSHLGRRQFLAAAGAALAIGGRAAEPAGRRLDFLIANGFEGAGKEDIEAVVRSAGDSIWQHCEGAEWEVPGFFVYPAKDSPITLFEHRSDGRIAIGLTPRGTYWAQFAYQFAHEFCHALAGHANNWRTTWLLGRKANHWLEESLCETASLFALRAMGRGWRENPPYPNWKDFHKALTSYAEDRLVATRKDLPAKGDFAAWFRAHEDDLRRNATRREWNNVVAARLLPLFEARPAGWGSVAWYNRTANRAPDKTLAAHFLDWRAAAPEGQRRFISELEAVFKG